MHNELIGTVNEMRKSGLAMIGLIFLMSNAHAQSSVTLYGIIDTAITFAKSGNGSGNLVRLDSGVSNGSRFGLTGTEDLGSGLKARFVVENGFATNTGAFQQGGLLFGRQAWVGLASTAGWSVTAGRQNSPMSLALIAADASAQIYWGNTQVSGNGVYQSRSATASDAGFQATSRVDNSILGSWVLRDLTLRLMVSTGDGNSSDSGRLLSGSATYASGPVMFTASFTRFRQYAADITPLADPAWETEWMVGGSFDFKVAQVFAGYYRFNPSEDNTKVTAQTFSNTYTYWLGVRIPVIYTDRIIAEALRTEFDYSNGHGRGTTLGITYEHPFSKRTIVYASYGQINNDSKSAAILWAGTAALNYPTVLGASPKAFSVGIRHLF
jgi:predicted porin